VSGKPDKPPVADKADGVIQGWPQFAAALAGALEVTAARISATFGPLSLAISQIAVSPIASEVAQLPAPSVTE
jgi:hypothetical protein